MQYIIKFFRLWILAVGLLCWSWLSAVNYCSPSAFGYGKSATGGGNAPVTLVSSVSEFNNALNKQENKVVIITKSLTFTSMSTIQDAQNLTIMALPGVTLTTAKTDAENSGILFIKRTSNIILRNLTFEGPGAYDINGNDLLCFENVTNAWVDHCDFSDGLDGNFDIKGESDDITITWCKFHYEKEPISGGSGGANDHRFSNLLGSSSNDKPSDGTYNITYGYCWWGNGCKERMIRGRNASVHFLNCYWNSSVANYCVGPENLDAYVEGCYFDVNLAAEKIFYQNYKGKNGVKYVDSYAKKGGLNDISTRTVITPSYNYTVLSYADAKSAVTHSTCGAGATLIVTNQAEVSSSCDSETGPVDPITVNGDCCVDLSLGATPTVANGGIPSDFSLLSVVANLAKGTWDNGFLNMGGNADYITFDFSAYSATIEAVEFDVTIPNWAADKNTIAYHWNNNSNSLYTISSAEKEVVKLSAPANAKSFTIQRSASTSTRISGVCFQLHSTASGVEQTNVQKPSIKTQKILQNGQVLIKREGVIYSILGTKIQ